MDSAVPLVPRGVAEPGRHAGTLVPAAGRGAGEGHGATEGILGARSRMAPERGVGEGDLEALGTPSLPAEPRARSHVAATGLRESGHGAR